MSGLRVWILAQIISQTNYVCFMDDLISLLPIWRIATSIVFQLDLESLSVWSEMKGQHRKVRAKRALGRLWAEDSLDAVWILQGGPGWDADTVELGLGKCELREAM